MGRPSRLRVPRRGASAAVLFCSSCSLASVHPVGSPPAPTPERRGGEEKAFKRPLPPASFVSGSWSRLRSGRCLYKQHVLSWQDGESPSPGRAGESPAERVFTCPPIHACSVHAP